MRWGQFNRTQRMQLKAWVSLLGVLLLLVLLVARLFHALRQTEPEDEIFPSQEPHIPVVEELKNVWILQSDAKELLVFRDGEKERYRWQEPQEGETEDAAQRERLREQVADITLTDGLVTLVRSKTEKINGKVLGADADGIVIEGVGRMPVAEDCKGYRLYDTLQMCTPQDIRFGYSFTDFCVEDGEICAILMVKEEAMKYIRVLLKASDYAGLLQSAPVITADSAFEIVYGDYGEQKTELHEAGEQIDFGYDSPYFESDRVRIVPQVLTGKLCITNLNRSQGTPQYKGTLELIRTQDGIAVVNEVLLEDYLCSVVPSEMPAGYPAEALKAQAICARTYAYGHMEHAGYPAFGAHVDDSTAYQVYNNIVEQDSTTTAVKETYGQLLLTPEGTPAGAYYYSTSCGVGSDANVWKTEAAAEITYLHAKPLSRTAMEAASQGGQEELGEALRDEETFEKFITGRDENAFEAQEGWYRWSYTVKKIDPERIEEMLKKRYAANSRLVLTFEDGEYISKEIGEVGKLRDIYIEKRGAGGVADELVLEAEGGSYKVISEHNIRYVLNDGETKIVRQDGSSVASPTILPSGFFIITAGKEKGTVVGYTLNGGGFGHGVGMSQNGAKSMAKDGYTAEDILGFFYEGCTLETIYDEERSE